MGARFFINDKHSTTVGATTTARSHTRAIERTPTSMIARGPMSTTVSPAFEARACRTMASSPSTTGATCGCPSRRRKQRGCLQVRGVDELRHHGAGRVVPKELRRRRPREQPAVGKPFTFTSGGGRARAECHPRALARGRVHHGPVGSACGEGDSRAGVRDGVVGGVREQRRHPGRPVPNQGPPDGIPDRDAPWRKQGEPHRGVAHEGQARHAINVSGSHQPDEPLSRPCRCQQHSRARHAAGRAASSTLSRTPRGTFGGSNAPPLPPR